MVLINSTYDKHQQYRNWMAIRNADAGGAGIALRIEPGAGGLAVSGVTVTGCWLGMNDAGASGGGPNKTISAYQLIIPLTIESVELQPQNEM
jgi:hypothetical protein